MSYQRIVHSDTCTHHRSDMRQWISFGYNDNKTFVTDMVLRITTQSVSSNWIGCRSSVSISWAVSVGVSIRVCNYVRNYLGTLRSTYVPVIFFVHHCSSPFMHWSHWRHESTIHPTPTSSPILTFETFEPTAWTIPANSYICWWSFRARVKCYRSKKKKNVRDPGHKDISSHRICDCDSLHGANPSDTLHNTSSWSTHLSLPIFFWRRKSRENHRTSPQCSYRESEQVASHPPWLVPQYVNLLIWTRVILLMTSFWYFSFSSSVTCSSDFRFRFWVSEERNPRINELTHI